MELKYLEDIVDDMIVQHNYPGFELRSLNLSLPQSLHDAPLRLYVQALKSKNLYVRLVALRWFQAKPGLAKNHSKEISSKLEDNDPFVRLEAIRTIEIAKTDDKQTALKIASLCKDPEESVRIQAVKSCGHMLKNGRKIKRTKLSIDQKD